MKALFGYLVAGLVFQSAARPRPTPAATRPQCIPTEHMPISGLHRRPPEPMPVAKPDSTLHSRMPVGKQVPCYLADSLDDSLNLRRR
jgi:hypothetical protein